MRSQQTFVDLRTCPPGPELLAKDSCTASRGMEELLNFSIQSLAEDMFSSPSGSGGFGGFGSVEFDTERIEGNSSTLKLELIASGRPDALLKAKFILTD